MAGLADGRSRPHARTGASFHPLCAGRHRLRDRTLSQGSAAAACGDRRLQDAAYLAGDYSIADMACWPWVRAASVIGIDVSGFRAIPAWFDSIAARPAVERGTAVKNSANASSARPVLTAEQWSNLFGENMLKSSGTPIPGN
nr:glutathione binding-like protein [Sphingosinicella soli]